LGCFTGFHRDTANRPEAPDCGLELSGRGLHRRLVHALAEAIPSIANQRGPGAAQFARSPALSRVLGGVRFGEMLAALLRWGIDPVEVPQVAFRAHPEDIEDNVSSLLKRIVLPDNNVAGWLRHVALIIEYAPDGVYV
jgi:hypothetical protein